MARPEFPSIPIGAKPETTKADQNDAAPGYSQFPLEGLASESGELLEFGNCLVTSAVTFRKRGKGNEWRCTIHVEPDLMHPDQEGDFEAYALAAYADTAQRLRLRPGDRAVMQGTVRHQTIALGNGNTTTINRFAVAEIAIIARSPRKSITVYQQENGGDTKR